MTGKGSTFTTTGTELHIGYNGQSNSLIVSAGGQVTNGDSWIGENYSATGNFAVVSGSGSRRDNSGTLNVGKENYGTGVLIVDNGALVTASAVSFGTTSDTISITETDVTALFTTSASMTDYTTDRIYLGVSSNITTSTARPTRVSA